MKNILVLTDFSENAKAAERYALQLAIRVKADLMLYNVYRRRRKDISGNVVWPHDAPPSFELQSISKLESRVNELNHELAKIKDNVYKPAIRHLGNAGSLTHKLNDIIAENNIWLVIMGTKGESFASTVIFGSNVFKVLETINCPVLIIPKNSEYTSLQKIAYATDFRSSDMNIIEWLYELTGLLNTGLSIVHVSSDMVTDQEKDISKKQENLYHEKFPKSTIKLYTGENIQHSLHKIVEQLDVSILALLHRKYGFFESLFDVSTSHKMIKHTEIPVLIFPGLQKE
jgi:nucleotide-binding universal stress UspA family protein